MNGIVDYKSKSRNLEFMVGVLRTPTINSGEPVSSRFALYKRHSLLRQVVVLALAALFGLLAWLGTISSGWTGELPAARAVEDVTDRPELLYPAQGSQAISSEKITQFVEAYLQVLALIEQREGELRSAETMADSRRIEQDIQTQAFTIIEQAGLTRQEYLQLLGLANTDSEFRDRIITHLQEVQP